MWPLPGFFLLIRSSANKSAVVVLGWLVILDILIILLVIGVVGLVVDRRPKWIWKRLDKNKDRRTE